MKTYVLIVTLFMGLAFLACQDAKVDVQHIEKDLTYYKSVGEEIPFQTGLDWINFYRQSNSGRTDLLNDLSIADGQLNTMLGSVDNLAGVAFHYGYDADGSKTVIAIPINEALSLWSDIPGRVYLDASTGAEISRADAQAAAQRYRDAHPNRIWFHFFGADVFSEISGLPFFNSIEVEQAVNILDLTPQLLLVVWNESLPSGRTTGELGTIYDASNPCPPCGVHD